MTSTLTCFHDHGTIITLSHCTIYIFHGTLIEKYLHG